MEHDKYAIYIIWLVVIVGVVSLVAVFTGVNSQTVAGQAYTRCVDSDGGNDPYTFGTTRGVMYGIGFGVFEDYCFDGIDIVESCDSCHLYEHHCNNGRVEETLYYSYFYDSVYCENGEWVDGNLGTGVSPDDDELPLVFKDDTLHDHEGGNDNDETYTDTQEITINKEGILRT